MSNEEQRQSMIDAFEGKMDARPRIGGWAPGYYSCKCLQCKKYFTGAKRAYNCADCAYKYNTYSVGDELAVDFLNLNCPKCQQPHVDKDEWSTRLHKKHLCEHCDHIWDPFEGTGHQMYSFGIDWKTAEMKSKWKPNGHGANF